MYRQQESVGSLQDAGGATDLALDIGRSEPPPRGILCGVTDGSQRFNTKKRRITPVWNAGATCIPSRHVILYRNLVLLCCGYLQRLSLQSRPPDQA